MYGCVRNVLRARQHCHVKTDEGELWNRRKHPAYQDISEATRVLLERGRLVYQGIILKKGATGRVAPRLAGSCIMLTQLKSSEIVQTLPPSSWNMMESFWVLFTTRRQHVRKAKMLEIPRDQSLRFARLRQEEVREVCADTV